MLERLGLFGLFIGCLLSATIIPFSSEALLTGALLLDYSPWTVILVATLGNTIGGMTCYLLGWLCKWSWIEKYLKIKEEKLAKAHQKVEKYGCFAALLAWLPSSVMSSPWLWDWCAPAFCRPPSSCSLAKASATWPLPDSSRC